MMDKDSLQDSRRGVPGSGSEGQHAPWDSTAKSSNSGVMMVNGAWKMLSNKGCG
jgi:hypothetical protein